MHEKISKLPGANLTGYMPLRADFDVEHDNDAEVGGWVGGEDKEGREGRGRGGGGGGFDAAKAGSTSHPPPPLQVILADMEFSPMDSAAERTLKLQVLQIYNAKLDERERRKRFVIERGLLDYKKLQNMDRRRPKDERELMARMRLFARFHSAEEHEQFVEGLLTAKRLRKRIEQLQHYRQVRHRVGRVWVACVRGWRVAALRPPQRRRGRAQARRGGRGGD